MRYGPTENKTVFHITKEYRSKIKQYYYSLMYDLLVHFLEFSLQCNVFFLFSKDSTLAGTQRFSQPCNFTTQHWLATGMKGSCCKQILLPEEVDADGGGWWWYCGGCGGGGGVVVVG